MRELDIDWAALLSAFQMTVPDVRRYLSLESGDVLKLPPNDPSFAKIRAEPNIYKEISPVPSRVQYQWLDEFVKLVEDVELKAQIEMAINGKGAFRRFKDILISVPDERSRWFEFRDLKLREWIVEWVRENGIESLEEPQWQAESPVPQQDRKENKKEHIEALRDELIEWASTQKTDALSPVLLEELAHHIGQSFRVYPLK
ncbi:hypothetical protein KAI87_04415 [Myxococcota bacterium]|nr:hypothetical protein [Myxococcota bacterium]